MKKVLSASIIALLILTVFPFSSFATGTNLNFTMTTDNMFDVYLSNTKTDSGTWLGYGVDWTKDFSFSSVLNSTQDTYYLHIIGRNFGGPAGVLGEFNLSNTDFHFANNTQLLTTNSADLGAWKASLVNFGGTSAPVIAQTGSWGARSIGSSNEFIWVNKNVLDYQPVFFSTQINRTVTPEPISTTLFLLGAATLGTGKLLKRKKS